jgi:2,4-dienoyl-CoA reductase-like NADH-dependent reductase (Old Yellow Enzyme family)
LTLTELFSPLQLRFGGTLRNRVANASMAENLAGSSQLPDKHIISLDRRGTDGAGPLITDNVMIHAEAPTGPGGVVLDKSRAKQ